MRRFISLFIAFLTLSTSFMGLVSATAYAATPPAASNPANNGQALEIAPPVIYLTASPGQTIKTQIYLRNISSGNLIVTGQANDFTASGEDGTPKLVLDNNAAPGPYSIKNWISPPAKLLIIPREIKTMTINMTIPADASPGGHYGVIRFTATPPELQGTGVSLSASLGALILLTVNGDIKDQLSVKEFSVNNGGSAKSFFESGPLNFVERFENTGNEHEQPTGQVAITDMFGKKIASVNVNVPPKSILPASIRKFDEPLDKSVIGNKRLFGRYHAKMNVTYSTEKKVLTASIAFWVIPYRLIAIVIAVLIVGFIGLRYLLRYYNRRVIARSQKGRRK